jgi:hypothetical protein
LAKAGRDETDQEFLTIPQIAELLQVSRVRREDLEANIQRRRMNEKRNKHYIQRLKQQRAGLARLSYMARADSFNLDKIGRN